MSLTDRVTSHVAAYPGQTLDEIARGVQARTSAVRTILNGEAFSSLSRLGSATDRAKVYYLAVHPRDGSGRATAASQGDLIHRLLQDGEWHTTREIHRRCGFSRLNSRIAELRSKKGLTIECERVDGVKSGPDAQRYRLVAGASEADDGTAAEGAIARPGGLAWGSEASPSSASDASEMPDEDDGTAARLVGLGGSDQREGSRPPSSSSDISSAPSSGDSQTARDTTETGTNSRLSGWRDGSPSSSTASDSPDDDFPEAA